MTNGREYQDSISINDALDEIKRCSGTQFDPKLADTFIKVMSNK